MKRKSSPKKSAVPDAKSLKEYKRLQQWVAAAVMTPLDRNDGMRRRRADGSSTAAHVARFIKPNDRLTSFERLEIYNVQYWLRIIASLREDFPALEAVLGEERFTELAKAYLQKHPSRSFTLRNLGRHMETFLRREPRWAGKNATLAIDIARFEWAQVLAFDEAALPPLTPETAATDPRKLKLRLQPYVTLLDLAYPVDTFITALQKLNETSNDRLRSEASNAIELSDKPQKKKPRPPLPKPAPTFLAVHRVETLLYTKRLTAEAFRLLTALQRGLPLARACDAAFAKLPRGSAKIEAETTRRSQLLQAWFANWAELGWLASR